MKSLKMLFFVGFISLGTTTGVLSQEVDIFNKLNLKDPALKEVKNAYLKEETKQAAAELLKVFRNKKNSYIKVSEDDIAFIKKKFPKGVKTSIKVANQVRDKYFIYRDDWAMEKTNVPYEFEKEINWDKNPFGDPEWTWMLNRHGYWVDLGKAYYLTGKEKYAKTIVNQLTHWVKNNPLVEDNLWTSWRRIEAGIRAENWIKAFEFIKDSKQVTPEFLKLFLNALYVHAEYLNSGFNSHSQTSNWGVLEFHGLFNIAMFMSEFKKADEWLDSAIEKLAVCAQIQILEDGTQWEQSPMYHNEVFHCYMNVVLLANRQGIKLPKIFEEKTRAMAYANIAWQKPNYHQPLYGDSDDTDLRGILTTAAILFNEGVIKSRAYPKVGYHNYFLFNTSDKQAYNKLKAEPPEFTSAYLQSSGGLYSRSSWSEDAFYSSIHLKNLGGGHSHYDLLSFTLYGNHRDYLIDPGRYTYVNNEWRKYFKDSKAHNTLSVDRLSSSVYAASWSNSFEGKTEGVFTTIEDDFDYAEAINTAYSRLEDPIKVKRRMLYLKPDIWLIFDSFSGGEKAHVFSQFFNFPNKEIKLKEGGLITTYEDNNLAIRPLNQSEVKIYDAWMSPEYNLKKETKRAEIFQKNTGFTSFITLLYFPEKRALEYKKIPVFDLSGNKVTQAQAEAVKIIKGDKIYILLVAHNETKDLESFLKVGNSIVSGEVVLIERDAGKENAVVHVIK